MKLHVSVIIDKAVLFGRVGVGSASE